MKPLQRKAILRNGEKKSVYIISIFGVCHICFKFILFVCCVKMDMVPLILFPLPAGTMLNSVSRGREGDIAENNSFSAPWFLGVGSAGSRRNAAASTSSSSAHLASSVPSNFSTHSLFSIRHLPLHTGPNIRWPAASPWTSTGGFAAKCLQWDISPWNFCHQRVHSGKSQRENLQKVLLVPRSQVTAQGCSEARPCFLYKVWISAWEVGYSLGAQAHPGVVATPYICYA